MKLIFNCRRANAKGLKLIADDAVELVFQKLILDTGSYVKSSVLLKRTYGISTWLDP